ncbi:MAG: hypothetical protein K1Y36_05300 [Blastocatellia bacterium]|nr:hypothetical protein [Blastocatellia bacterium]
MKKILAVLFGWGMLGATLALVMAQPSTQDSPDCDWKKIQSLALRFVDLRSEMRGGSETRKQELRHWNSALHQVMAELGEKLPGCRVKTSQVTGLLGQPDKVFESGQVHEGNRVPKGETHLGYQWRGGHDVLYLIVVKGRVVRSDWWFAGE